MKRGQSEIVSVVLITMIVVVLIFVSYTWSVPQIEKSKEIGELTLMQNKFQLLDQSLRIVSIAEGASRTESFAFSKGELKSYPEISGFEYTLLTKQQCDESKVYRTKLRHGEGRIVIGDHTFDFSVKGNKIIFDGQEYSIQNIIVKNNNAIMPIFITDDEIKFLSFAGKGNNIFLTCQKSGEFYRYTIRLQEDFRFDGAKYCKNNCEITMTNQNGIIKIS
ncbi:MAG: archaellin/type IV pilin N-terminal domain-containing protein [Candidatus Woesearchaeota archaeon]